MKKLLGVGDGKVHSLEDSSGFRAQQSRSAEHVRIYFRTI